MSFKELEKHLHYLKDEPTAVPYYTSYYNENWGFCLSYDEFKTLDRDGEYHVVIDSSLEDGSLTYGQTILKGNSKEEIIFSSYLCHPSMANNELSGPLALAFLYKKIKNLKNRRYTYRFILAPETIGVISFLSKHGAELSKNIIAGYVLTCCADNGDFTYQKSKQGNAITDKIAEHILKYSSRAYTVRKYRVGGSDERQYCSPGFNFPVGSLMRTPYQLFDEYHTSLDNKDFISFAALNETIEMYFEFVEAFEINYNYYNTVQFCEPQLGKRGLYPDQYTGDMDRDYLHILLHLLSFSDGKTSLLKIAEHREVSILKFQKQIEMALSKKILSVKQ